MRSHMGISHSFHHKYAIADADILGSDPTVLTGSHNWSSNAENNSDENTLIIHDATIANIYLQEFEKRWGELGTPTAIDELIDIELSVFPNPTAGKVTVKSDLEISQIYLYAIDGKLISVNKKSEIEIYTKGTYFLKIFTVKGSTVRKIVVE